jgi:cytochrome c oxidase cbb3-type subunit 3
MECWGLESETPTRVPFPIRRITSSKMMNLKRNTPTLLYSMAPWLVGLLLMGFLGGCDRLPGKPDEAARWKRPTEVVDFNHLYAENCSGCHGADGRLGPARPLNDPLYLALVNDEILRDVVARGVPKTAMPAFVQQQGGNLTDKQIEVLVQGIRSRWARSDQFAATTLPAYRTEQDSKSGDVSRGLVIYKSYCAQCHDAAGRGQPKGGSVVDPNYLALVSDQSLRTTVIAGRSDLGKPDWRDNVPGRSLSPQEISDVVAWIASHRGQDGVKTR